MKPMELIIRRAAAKDIGDIAAIYEDIHTREEAGDMRIGWVRDVYPTKATARTGVKAGDMFAALSGGQVLAAARINREQVDVYARAAWQWPAPPERVMVMHTLVVSPAAGGQGIGRAFVRFYEDYALAHDCPFLRIDTNEKNAAARALYKKLGYREADIVDCVFNGIPGVRLVCLEKRLEI